MGGGAGGGESHHGHGSNAPMPDFDGIKSQFHFPEKQAAANLGICLTSLKKLCRAHNVKRWPYRKIHSAQGQAMDEAEILAYCTSDQHEHDAERSPSPDSHEVSATGDAHMSSPSGENGHGDGGAEAKSEPGTDVRTRTPVDVGGAAAVDDAGGGAGGGGGGASEPLGGEGELFPSIFKGGRIRYKFVCTPPDGYVPSEIDADTLPKGFFGGGRGAFSSLRGASQNKAASPARPPRQHSAKDLSAEAAAAQGDGDYAMADESGEVQQGLETGADARDRGGGEMSGDASASVIRKGAIGKHMTDYTVFSPKVVKLLEASGQIVPMPFNCQPPKKRFRTSFGYVVDEVTPFAIHNVPVRPLTPPPKPPPVVYR